MNRTSYRLLLLCGCLALVACGGGEPEPTPLVAAPTEAVAAVVTPTLVPEPTLLPTEPPATLPPPIVVEEDATAAPEVVEEPTAEPAAEETDAATDASAAPVGDLVTLSSPDDFIPAGRNPLTGELVDDPSVLQRRPILCKISNSPAQWVRPQSGLNSADIIFEHYTEAAITRFSALFYGKTPEKVGPVRSARLIDLELPLMYDASLCFSGGSSGQGANRGVYNLVFDTQFANRMILTQSPSYYRTGEDKPYEHTFYNRPQLAWEELANAGLNTAPNFVSNMAFSSEPPAQSAPAGYISIGYGSGVEQSTFIEWTYDAERGKYMRAADGGPIVDANTGEQVAVSNVIILKAPHVINRNICETQTETQCIAFSTEIQIWGGGFASIFRDGRQINGSWQRNDRNANGMMFTFYDEAGNPLPLQIGNTWIQVAPYEYIETPIEVRP